MRILLLGKNGQVGWELQRTLAPLGEVYATDSLALDLGNVFAIRKLVRAFEPDVIVNAAAYTAVDRAEKDSSLAHAINGTAPGVLAEEAALVGAGLIHYSTDYVFDGKKGAFYTEMDSPNPVNTYGESKLAGENAIQQVGGAYLILRTSWVYSLRRECFVTKVLDWSRKMPTLRIVTDQIGSPTWCRRLAIITSQILMRSKREMIPHLAGSGSVSRFDWAQSILQQDPNPEERIADELLAAHTAEFSSLAQRPLYTAMNCERFCTTFNIKVPRWDDDFQLAMRI